MFTECPWVPSSIAKVATILAAYLKQRGWDVHIACPALHHTITGGPVLYNPAYSAKAAGDDAWYPDETIPVWAFVSPGHAAELAKRYDAVASYATPYAPPGSEFNKAVSMAKRPSVVYAISEALMLPPHAAKSVEAYSVLAAPTEFTLKTFAAPLGLRGYTEVVPHGLPREMYPACIADPVHDLVFLAKNHPRKDVYAALETFAILLRRGEADSLGLYVVDAVTSPSWGIQDIAALMEHKHGVSMMNKIEVLSPPTAARGLTEKELRELLCKGRLLLYPSYGESFGLPPLESVLLGRPFVSTMHPALVEIWGPRPLAKCRVTHAHGVPLCETVVTSLASKVRQALSHLLDLYSQELAAAQHYTPEHMASRFSHALDKALSDPTPIGAKLSH